MPRFCAILSENRAENLLRCIKEIGGNTSLQSGKIVLSLIENSAGKAELYSLENLNAVGEVTLYNRDEIRKELKLSPTIKHSDGELLLKLYAVKGIAGFNLARGIFAFVIADGETLLLVRDAIGGRTLFHTFANKTWAVSSSLRALRNWSQLEVKLNLSAVASFLTFAYLPGNETLLENVFELLPAHALRLFPDGKSELHNYYEPREVFDETKSVADYVGNLRETLEESVKIRLPSENEQVGVFLSGGVDSSLVTAFANKFHPRKVNTYSISFGKDAPNETAYAGLVAAHCQTNHQVLSFTGNEIADYLAETVALLDCPVGDPLTVPNLLLARAAAKDGLRVVLNGEGGDPCFGGPKNLPMLIYDLQRDASDSLSTTYLSSYRKCYDDFDYLLTPDFQKYLQSASKLERLVQPFLENPQMNSYLNRLLYTNLRTKLAHHILPKVERLTASCGIEGRSPLADKSVVDCAFACPPELKLTGTIEKWILKEAVRDLLPATIIDRPKSGMRVPVQDWLNSSLKTLSRELLFGKRAQERGLFQTKTIKQWLEGEGAIYARQGGKIWLLLTLELWIRSYID